MKKVILSLGVCFFFLTSCDKWLTIRPENEIEKTKIVRDRRGILASIKWLVFYYGLKLWPYGAFAMFRC